MVAGHESGRVPSDWPQALAEAGRVYVSLPSLASCVQPVLCLQTQTALLAKDA